MNPPNTKRHRAAARPPNTINHTSSHRRSENQLCTQTLTAEIPPHHGPQTTYSKQPSRRICLGREVLENILLNANYGGRDKDIAGGPELLNYLADCLALWRAVTSRRLLASGSPQHVCFATLGRCEKRSETNHLPTPARAGSHL